MSAGGITEGYKCNGDGCTNAAKLQCPTCLKTNDPSSVHLSYFCSQDCFKANWAPHKLVHKKNEPFVEKNIYPGFQYTGALRAWPQSPRRLVPAHIQKPDYAETGYPESEYTERGTFKVLNDEEIEKMRVVCRIGREVLDIAAAAVAAGVKTDEIDGIVHEETILRDAYPSTLNYRNFPKSCCTSVNEIVCHGIPDLRPLQDGDIVNIDVSCYHRGFHSDLNETYLVGNVDESGKKLVNCARDCLDKAIAIVKPGVQYREIGDVIERHAKTQGCSVVKTYCGHGVHKLFHCSPNVPHYAKNKAVGTMRAGHCFTIEPMINEGSWRDETWPDNWTSTTEDGKRSAQFEHTLLVTDKGVEVLTAKRK